MTHSQTHSGPSSKAKPWYREFWFWFIVTPILVVVILAPIAVIVAVATDDGPAEGAYEKRGRLYYEKPESAPESPSEPEPLSPRIER